MPEKTVQDVAPFVREQYEKGRAAFGRQNYDYAVELFNSVLKLEPGFFDARAALRATQLQRAKAGKGFLKKMLGRASSSPSLAKAQMNVRRNPAEAIYAAEQVLNGDPNNTMAHRILAEAAAAAGLPRTAVFAMESAFRQNPGDRKLMLQMASLYADNGQIAKAEALYSEVLKSNPQDAELQRELKDLSARRTLVEGGYDRLNQEGASYRDVLHDAKAAVELEQANRSMQTDESIAQLLRDTLARLEAEPGDVRLVRQVADLYYQQKDYDRALDFLQRIKDSDKGADPAVDKRIHEIAMKQFDQRLAALDPEDVDFDAEKRALQQERLEAEISAARRMAERYPTELQYRFELGEILFKAGKISEAIQEFQKAQANPHRRIATLNYLGQCFSRRGLYDVAVRTFQKALEEKATFDEEKKDLIYQLGMALESMGKKDEAIESFKQVYEVDIGFRDVAARVDAYYAEQ